MKLSATVIGLTVGIILGVVGAFGGFTAFLLVLVLALLGLGIGRVIDGKLDLSALSGRSNWGDRRP